MAADKPVASAAEALYMCKLPRTQFRIISEKKKCLTVVRSSLGAVMEAEGYGRGKKNAGEGKGKLSYKTGTPPAWWNDACEAIIPWSMFGGVNKPKEWKGTWSYAMYDLLVIAYTFYLKEEELVDSYILPHDDQQHGECSHVQPVQAQFQEYQVQAPLPEYHVQAPVPEYQVQAPLPEYQVQTPLQEYQVVGTVDLTAALSNEFLLEVDDYNASGCLADLNYSNTDLAAMLDDLENDNN